MSVRLPSEIGNLVFASPAVQDVLAQEKKRLTALNATFVLIAIAILFVTFIGSEIDIPQLIKDRNNMVEYVSRYFPPDFRYWRSYMNETWITISMAVWGTVLAAIAGIPAGLLASENLCPAWIVFPVRRVMDFMRAVNEFVFAIMFVVAVGLGPFAGTLALFVHTTGTFGKLYSEAVEAIEDGPVEGIRATGASKIQEIVFGVIPQVVPLWLSFTLYRFEANIRSASVVGLVGAGGIGMALDQSLDTFQYQQSCAILIILVVTVSIIDTVSSKLRSHLV
ncbi:MAG: phosphonate ABC transporter, permease protein PhnE [Leptolyngbyaceae bacterium]|nr:phosphonate ABC transporter, permease protein PhnE [Leptolyngbyaceae bacterium]